MPSKDENTTDAFKIADGLYRKGDFERALKYFLIHLKSNPKDALVLNMAGHLYRKIKGYENLDEQIKYFKKALEIKPDYRSAVRNLAYAYSMSEQYENAFETYQKLFKLEPLADDYFSYACLNIKAGDFQKGWEYYEYRFDKCYGKAEYLEFDKPRWSGEKIPNKTLLIQYEQGFGDSIQFLRYLKTVKPLVGKIIFRVQDELIDLFKHNLANIELVKNSTPVDELKFDFHIPLMSIIHVLKLKKEDIPLSKGYIKADPKKVQKYEKKFFNTEKLKVGICWFGRQTGNRSRNVPLKYFYPLAKLKNIKLYSFQKGEGARYLEDVPNNIEITDLGKTFNDFSDTAAAMANLDLFITADNSVFNLAGAMGIKTIVLLNRDSEWRWFLDEDKTPWYDSVEIFKKKNENDSWSLLIERVVEEVKNIDAV